MYMYSVILAEYLFLMTGSYGSSIFQTEFQRYLPVHKKLIFHSWLDVVYFHYKIQMHYFFNLMCIMIVYFKSKDNVQFTMKPNADL